MAIIPCQAQRISQPIKCVRPWHPYDTQRSRALRALVGVGLTSIDQIGSVLMGTTVVSPEAALAR